MEKLRVPELKAEAKSRGLRGYSKLRKAELIDLLKLDLENKQREADKQKREAERQREVKRQRIAEKNRKLIDLRRSYLANKKREERQRKTEKNRKKRESKKRNKKKKAKALPDVDIDQLVKDVEEELKRKEDKRSEACEKLKLEL